MERKPTPYEERISQMDSSELEGELKKVKRRQNLSNLIAIGGVCVALGFSMRSVVSSRNEPEKYTSAQNTLWSLQQQRDSLEKTPTSYSTEISEVREAEEWLMKSSKEGLPKLDLAIVRTEEEIERLSQDPEIATYLRKTNDKTNILYGLGGIMAFSFSMVKGAGYEGKRRRIIKEQEEKTA